MSRPVLSLIAAVARNGAIGRDNRLLMHLPGDLPRFKRLTAGAPVLMGRKTWDSIGRPLPGRRCIVVTRNREWRAPGAEAVASLADAMEVAGDVPRAFVIGGGELYAEALPLAHELLLTEIDADLPGDTCFPHWDRSQFGAGEPEHHTAADGTAYRYITYTRQRRD